MSILDDIRQGIYDADVPHPCCDCARCEDAKARAAAVVMARWLRERATARRATCHLGTDIEAKALDRAADELEARR